MKKNEKVYQTLIQQSVEAIYLFDPKTKRVLETNPAFLKFLGYTAEEAQKLRVYDFVAHDKKSIDKNVQNILKSARITIGERLWRCKDGSLIDVLVTAGKIQQRKKDIIFIIARDITQRKQIDEQIRYLSFHDKLTGLYNRAYLEEALKRLNTKRQLPLSLIVGDADGLKLINDGFGHYEGDKMLKRIAQIMKDCCRDEDIVARWGGDEFAVLLPKTKSKDAINICQRIKRSCRKIKEPIPLSIALGTSTKNAPEQDIEELLRGAEDRMYRQKSLQSKITRDSIISSLEKTLSDEGYEMKKHAQHLRKMVKQIGKALRLPESQLKELNLLANLHDLGKIIIPESILNKPGKLSPKERKIVQKHPEVGYRITKSFPELISISEAVLAHHERWNGTGYPRGLKGKEIPLNARILALADAYDVMTHKRVYQEAISHREALEEIKKYSGTRFDPKLTKIFIKIISKSKT